VISDSGIISGQFTKAEIDELVNVLNAGALEVPIIPDPISEYTISPTLGIDVQEKGMLAVILSLGAVLGFMLVY
jgi:SecD/SecF fusion protein